jgi:hypothetical protein
MWELNYYFYIINYIYKIYFDLLEFSIPCFIKAYKLKQTFFIKILICHLKFLLLMIQFKYRLMFLVEGKKENLTF